MLFAQMRKSISMQNTSTAILDSPDGVFKRKLGSLSFCQTEFHRSI